MGPDWEAIEDFADTVTIAGVTIALAGFSARHRDGDVAIGSAASSGAPHERAYFELLERASIVEATCASEGRWVTRDANGRACGVAARDAIAPASDRPARRRYARSNGVAISSSWSEACQRAEWELIERDRVLRSWYGGARPEPVHAPAGSIAVALRAIYDIEAYRFDGDGDAHVAGVFAFPRCEEAPLAYGFAARDAESSAVAAAEQECVQRMAFLWGEQIPSAEPCFAPTPEFHQELYLWPPSRPRLRSWLEGAHVRADARAMNGDAALGRRLFVDITPPWLISTAVVAKALPERELPLIFGEPPSHLARKIHRAARIHPLV